MTVVIARKPITKANTPPIIPCIGAGKALKASDNMVTPWVTVWIAGTRYGNITLPTRPMNAPFALSNWSLSPCQLFLYISLAWRPSPIA